MARKDCRSENGSAQEPVVAHWAQEQRWSKVFAAGLKYVLAAERSPAHVNERLAALAGRYIHV